MQGISSSIGGMGGRGGIELGPPPALARRGSRLTSASPLLGRSTVNVPRLSRVSSLDILPQHERPSSTTGSDDLGGIADLQLGLDPDEQFELYGPAASVNTQTAAQSQWVNAALENEAHNFLVFLDNHIKDKIKTGDEGDDAEQGVVVTMDELLPPSENSNIVGAQALLHILSLATRGLIGVNQQEPFGDITLSIESRGMEEKVATSVEIEDIDSVE